MDPRVEEIKTQLREHLPGVDELTLANAAYEWVAWLGRDIDIAAADAGLRSDFLRRFGGACAIEGSHVWAR